MAYIRFGIDRIPGDKTPAASQWKLAALTFFDPKFATSNQIVDVLNLLNTFSETHLDIFLHGYEKTPPSSLHADDVVRVTVGGQEMFYDPASLKREVDRLEAKTSWRFSLEIDVVLVSQRLWYIGDGGYERDLANAIVLNLYRMLKDNKISSYSSFFSEIINFAKDYQGDDPAWDYSDSKLWRELKKSLFESFKAYLGFRQFQLKVEDYAVRDIRPKKA